MQAIKGLFAKNTVLAVVGGSLVLGIVAGLGVYYLLAGSPAPKPEFATAAMAPLSEMVTETGTVKAASAVDLGFPQGGRIASVRVADGQSVVAGQVLATLENADLAAQRDQAEANVAAQQAKLASIQSGARPEQISIDQTNVDQTKKAAISALQAAFVAADDAVHAKADQTFSNPLTATPTFNLTLPDQQVKIDLETTRPQLETMFGAWRNQIANVDDQSLDAALSDGEDNLATVRGFLDTLTSALASANANASVSATTLSDYQTSVALGRTNVVTALSALVVAEQAYKAAEGTLTLAQAPGTPEDIAAQQAAIDQATAEVRALDAQIAKTVIVAPISGTISASNYDPGEIAPAGTPIVSMISDSQAQVDIFVAETDVGKIKTGDQAQVTLTDQSGVSLPGTVITVDPAETMANGVASYKVTVQLTSKDPRVRPGMSASVAITTATSPRSLVIPASAVITKNADTYVLVDTGNGGTELRKVTLGIRGTDGVEVVSGLAAGERVAAFSSSAGAQGSSGY